MQRADNCSCAQIASSALGSDPATGGKGAEQAIDKASNVATKDKPEHKVGSVGCCSVACCGAQRTDEECCAAGQRQALTHAAGRGLGCRASFADEQFTAAVLAVWSCWGLCACGCCFPIAFGGHGSSIEPMMDAGEQCLMPRSTCAVPRPADCALLGMLTGQSRFTCKLAHAELPPYADQASNQHAVSTECQGRRRTMQACSGPWRSSNAAQDSSLCSQGEPYALEQRPANST